MTVRQPLRLRIAAGLLLVAALLCARPAAAQVVATGTLVNAGDLVTVPLSGIASVNVQLSGTWSGQPAAVFEASVDGGTTWWPAVTVRQADGTLTNTATAPGLFLLPNVGYTTARVRAPAAISSGSIAVTATRGYGDSPGLTISASLTPALTAAERLGVPLPNAFLVPCSPFRRTNCQ